MALRWSGRWVVLTGASGGLGRALAWQLAEGGAHVVAVGRNEKALEELKTELEARHRTQVVPLPLDLGRPDAAARLVDGATAGGREPLVWIASAGLHWHGESARLPPELAEAMLRVNALTPIETFRLVLPGLLGRHEGGLLAVTSLAALMPIPYQAYYSATKSMLHAYVQSLHHELAARREPVAVTLCAPGGMWTPMLTESSVGKLVASRRALRISVLPVERVAREALEALEAGRPLVVPGAVNRAYVQAVRLWSGLGTQSARLYDP